MFDDAYVEVLGQYTALRAKMKLQALSIAQRKCVYLNESNLAYYPDYYTENLCLQTCRVEAALKFCQCMPFFYSQISK